MHFKTILLALLPAAFALPTSLKRAEDWTPAPGTTVSCDKDFDKIISFYVGPQKQSVLNDACAAMMPACAYPERLKNETLCPMVMDWKLDGPQSTLQYVNVEDAKTANKLSGWQAKFSVTPDAASKSVTWTKKDCYGYFEQLVSKVEPNGCVAEKGAGVGSMTVGGTSSLKGTVFTLEIVKRQTQN